MPELYYPSGDGNTVMITITTPTGQHSLDLDREQNTLFIDGRSQSIIEVSPSGILLGDGKDQWRIDPKDFYRALYGSVEPSPALAGLLLAQQFLWDNQSHTPILPGRHTRRKSRIRVNG